MPRNKNQPHEPNKNTLAIIQAMGWNQTPKPAPMLTEVESDRDNFTALRVALGGVVLTTLIFNAAPHHAVGVAGAESAKPGQLVVQAEGTVADTAKRNISRIEAVLNKDMKEHKADPVTVEKVSGFIAHQNNGQTEFVAGNALLLSSSDPGKLGPGAVIGKIVNYKEGIAIEPYTLANGDFQVGQGDRPDVERIDIAAVPERGASDPSQWNVIQVNENGQTVLDGGGFPIQIGTTPSQPSGPTESFKVVG